MERTLYHAWVHAHTISPYTHWPRCAAACAQLCDFGSARSATTEQGGGDADAEGATGGITGSGGHHLQLQPPDCGQLNNPAYPPSQLVSPAGPSSLVGQGGGAAGDGQDGVRLSCEGVPHFTSHLGQGASAQGGRESERLAAALQLAQSMEDDLGMDTPSGRWGAWQLAQHVLPAWCVACTVACFSTFMHP